MTATPTHPHDPEAVVVTTGLAVGQVQAAANLLDAAVMFLHEHVERDPASFDVDYLAHLLADVRDLRTFLHQLEAVVEAFVARTMTADRVEFDGLLVERKGGGTRKGWDHDLLTGRVAAALVGQVTAPVVDTTTGELTDERVVADADLVEAIARAALSCRTRGSWSTTGLRALGVPFHDAVTTDRSRRTVHVSRGAVSETSETLEPPTPTETPE